MHQDDILTKRNMFVFYTILVVNMIYFALILLGIFENLYTHYLTFTTAMLVFIGIIVFFQINPRTIQVLLIVCWNISALILIIESNHLITLFLFICIFVITSIYNSPVLSILLIAAISTETIIIFKYNHSLLLQDTNQSVYISIIFLMMSVALCSLQVFFTLKLWRNQEQSTIHREQELSSKKGYLSDFFKNADDAIAVFDVEGKTIDLNPAFEKLYGWSREEALGRSLPLVPPQNIKEANKRYKRLAQGESIRVNTQDMHKDGTLIDVQITLSPIYNEHGEIVANSVISRDVAYQKENEKLVMQSEKLKVIGEMAAGLAHEIRNPLTVVFGFVQMMNADEKFPYKTYTTLIETELDRINLIVSEFLVLSKPQKQNFTKFAIGDVLREIIELFSLQFAQKNIELLVTYNNINPYIEGSPNQIKQVVINILKNALEAVDEGGRIEIKLCHDEQSAYLSIMDNGIGIPSHILERIFEPFFTTKESGTGLGMVITNKIVQEHNGTIKIRSIEKVGTEILIKLPCADMTDTNALNH